MTTPRVQAYPVKVTGQSEVSLSLWRSPAEPPDLPPTPGKEPPMRILVTYATRHDGTAQIAKVLGSVLREGEDDAWRPSVDVRAVEDVDDASLYDAVLIGSAVYMDRWLDASRHFAQRNAKALTKRPVWLFASGPVGEPPAVLTESPETAQLAEAVGARGYRTFAGRLRTADLGAEERAGVRGAHAAEGDYRDWSEIRAWAEEIGDALASGARN
jgi:menaquinone-dependent protoporphyrinogen oxidase